jgi:hypothetical protein
MIDADNTVESNGDDGFSPIYADYGGDELLEQAQGNAQAALVATVAFLLERGVPVSDWTSALGRSFATEWGDPEPWGPDEFLDAMLTNYRSLGAAVQRAEFGPDRAEADISGFPDPEQCERFGVSVTDVAAFHDTAVAIAADRGLHWTWSVEDAATARTRILVVPAAS